MNLHERLHLGVCFTFKSVDYAGFRAYISLFNVASLLFSFCGTFFQRVRFSILEGKLARKIKIGKTKRSKCKSCITDSDIYTLSGTRNYTDKYFGYNLRTDRIIGCKMKTIGQFTYFISVNIHVTLNKSLLIRCQRSIFLVHTPTTPRTNI